MRVLVFGDSITQGLWDSEGGWVARVRKQYDKVQLEDLSRDEPSIFNLGVSGDTTKDVVNRFDSETNARKRRHKLAFVFAVGVNDICFEKSQTTLEETKNNLKTLIKKAKEHSTKIMFVGLTPVVESRTTPVVWGNFFYRNRDILSLDGIIRELCSEHDVTYVPIFQSIENQAEALLPDGLHPDDIGHEMIANLVRPELDKLLQP